MCHLFLYRKEQQKRAKDYFDKMSSQEVKKLVETILCGLPGRTSEMYTMGEFRKAVDAYDGITEEKARENLYDFVKQIAPVAEANGIFLAIHPDDPPITLLGLPRIMSTASDVRKLLS